MQKVYIFQTNQYFADKRKGSLLDFLKYSIPFAIAFTFMDYLIHLRFDPIFQKSYITDQKYTDPISKKKRCYTLVKWAYSIIYYIISSIWAYKIMQGTTFMPTWLGGNGSVFVLVDQLPGLPCATLQMKVFYLLQAGKHFSRFFSHVFIRSEGNFYEYALHHGLSVFLIVFSYLSNQWMIGIFVLMLHDYSDFALILARMYRDYKHYSKKILDVIYVHAFIAWISCRIILFSYCCIFAATHSFIGSFQKLNAFELEVLTLPYGFMCFMMFGLQILHLFWTYYIAESFISVKVSDKVTHSYD